MEWFFRVQRIATTVTRMTSSLARVALAQADVYDGFGRPKEA